MKNITKLKIVLTFFLLIVLIFFASAKKPDSVKSEEFIKNTAIYDVIIVPGVPYNDAYWTKILLGRIYWSNYLYKNGIAKNIIYSGSAVYTPYIESKIMAMYGKELGIPEENIFVETNAEHSVENIYNSYQIAKEMGFTKIALATDPFQSRMMKGPSKRMNVEIDFIPFSFDILETMEINELDIDEEKAYVEDFVSLEERENFFERLKGTIGKNIDYKD
jgi:uncharacterized SAM-binding protein YcdF (DUF218 family)